MDNIKIQIYNGSSGDWEEVYLLEPPSLNSRIANPDDPIPDGGLWSYTLSIRLTNGLSSVLGWNPLRPNTFRKKRIECSIILGQDEYTGYLYCDKISWTGDIPQLEGSISIKQPFWDLLDKNIIQDPAENGVIPPLRALELRDLTALSFDAFTILDGSKSEYESIGRMIDWFQTCDWAKPAQLFRGTYNLSYPFQDKPHAQPYTAAWDDGALRDGTFLTSEGTEWTLTELEVCPKVDSVLSAVSDYYGVEYISVGDLSEFPDVHMTPPTIQNWPNIWPVSYTYVPFPTDAWRTSRDPRSQINVDFLDRFPYFESFIRGWATDIADANPEETFPWIYFDGDTREAALTRGLSYMYYYNREGSKGKMYFTAHDLNPALANWAFITVSTGITDSPNTEAGRWWIFPVANDIEYPLDYELFEGEWLRVTLFEEVVGAWNPNHRFDWRIEPEKYLVPDTSVPDEYRWDDITSEYYRVKLDTFNGVNIKNLLKDLFLVIRKPPYFIGDRWACNLLEPVELQLDITPEISAEPNTPAKLWISKLDEDRLDPLQKLSRNSELTNELTYIAPAFEIPIRLSKWDISTGLEGWDFNIVSISNKEDWNDRIQVDLVEAAAYLPFSYSKLYKSGDKVRFKGRYYSLIVDEFLTGPDTNLFGVFYTDAPMPGKIWSLYWRYRNTLTDFSNNNWEPISGNVWAEEVITIDTSRTYLPSVKLVTINCIPNRPFQNNYPYGEGFSRFHPYYQEITGTNYLEPEFLQSAYPIPYANAWGARIEDRVTNWIGWVDMTLEGARDEDLNLDGEPLYEWKIRINGYNFYRSSIGQLLIRVDDDLWIVKELTEWNPETNIARIKARRLWD